MAEDIRLLLDRRATVTDIRSRLDWLLRDAAPGDEHRVKPGILASIRSRDSDDACIGSRGPVWTPLGF